MKPERVRVGVKIDGEVMAIPAAFWKVSDAIWTGDMPPLRLNRRDCARLWRMLGKENPPKGTNTLFKAEDIDLLHLPGGDRRPVRGRRVKRF